MRYWKGILLFIIGVLCLFHFTSLEESQGKEILSEEANPIREKEVIIGMEYTLTMRGDTSMILSSHILDSIVHFKDLETIDTFLVRLVIDSPPSCLFTVKDIYVIDTMTNVFIRDIPYFYEEKEYVVFTLEKEFFQVYRPEYQIQIELEKQ